MPPRFLISLGLLVALVAGLWGAQTPVIHAASPDREVSGGPIPLWSVPQAGSVTVEAWVSAPTDDAGLDYATCEYQTTHPQIYFGKCLEGTFLASGLRFVNVQVPRNATIQSAHIQFEAGGDYSDDLHVELLVEDSANSLPFSANSRPEDRLLVPSVSAAWHISSTDPWSSGLLRNSPPVTALVQNIVTRGDWSPGNAMDILVKNVGPSVGQMGARGVMAYESFGHHPAKLVITYTDPAAPSTTVVARHASSPPIIDGDLREWYGLTATYLDRYNTSIIEKIVPEPWDNSVYLRTVWDAGHLYFGGVIYDDVIIGNNSEKPWGDDSLEVSVYKAATGTAQFTGSADGRQAYKGDLVNAMAFITSTIQGGWLIEGSIPVSRTGFSSFSANQSMPFNFALWDDDVGEVYGQSHMYWQSNSTYSYQADWGTLTLTDQPWPIPGTIRGSVWNDANRNGMRESGEPGLAGVEIQLVLQQATISTTVTSGTGDYLFAGIMAGKYGVVEQQPSWMPFSTTPDAVPVILPEGGAMTADFGDWRGRPTWLPLILTGGPDSK